MINVLTFKTKSERTTGFNQQLFIPSIIKHVRLQQYL